MTNLSESESLTETINTLNDRQKKESEEKQGDKHVMAKIDEFLLTNQGIVKRWMVSHPNQQLPIFYDQGKDKVLWQNRQQRRKQQKRQQQQRVKQARKQSSLKPSLVDIPKNNNLEKPHAQQGANNGGATRAESGPEFSKEAASCYSSESDLSDYGDAGALLETIGRADR